MHPCSFSNVGTRSLTLTLTLDIDTDSFPHGKLIAFMPVSAESTYITHRVGQYSNAVAAWRIERQLRLLRITDYLHVPLRP